MRRVVITADDFGLCAEIDEAICLLHDRGVVSRTSVLVNTPMFASSVEALRERPALEVAVHLNLTDGRPVLPVQRVSTLVDSRGCFRGGRHYGVVLGIITGRLSRREIHREWRAQLAKARDAGLDVCGLNAHGHLHLVPHLHGVVLALCQEFGIRQVRLVRSFEGPRGAVLHLCSLALLRKLRREGIPAVWPDRTLGLRRPGGVDRRIRLRDLARGPGSFVELIVHPSQGTNAYHDRWGYSGTDVTNWLLRHLATEA